ncbi:protein charybde [Diaphorina citri]|uniref:Protein charybde n=1 Tax=Diaphorina citri TaxID=121845 RepID=A0A1S3CWT8_DIACI|nr:protein charybde [Diaphorina citri]
MMKDHYLDGDSPHRDIRLNEVFNKITYIWHHNSVTKGSGKPTTMTCDVIESVRSDLNVPISNNAFQQEDIEDSASIFLSNRLEQELRAAKSAQLACGEVLLPSDLLPNVARDILRLAEVEPYGLKGCTLFINFETDQECRKIATITCDPNTVSTFELYLTLRQDFRHSWHSLLPQFLKNLTKGGTIMISRGFTLEKKRLYRTYSDSIKE